MFDLTVGSLAGWLTLVALIGTAWIVWRGGGAAAISTLQAANKVLADQVSYLEDQLRFALAMVAELRASRDIAQAIEPLKESLLRLEAQGERQAAAMETFMMARDGRPGGA